jgi:hypothetical protein
VRSRGEKKLQVVYSLSCKRLVEILHYIDLALGIADDDDHDTDTAQRLLEMNEKRSPFTLKCTRRRRGS